MDGGDNVQRQTNEPSDWAKGFLTPGMEEARSLFQEGPAKHYTEDNGSAIAGFGGQTDQALNSLFNQGMTGAGSRAGATDALNKFSTGSLFDTNTLHKLWDAGATNSYGLNPATGTLGEMASAGPGTADRLLGRVGDIVANGGNVGGFTDSRVGDLSTFGPGTEGRYRGDVGDVISGQATWNNPAMTGLGLSASGAYLGGSPWLDSMYDKAADAVTRNYRTAISPQIDGRFAMTSGGSGSGAAQNARDQAERNLGLTLGDMATGLYGSAYDQERGRQEAAKVNLGSQYLSGTGLRTSAAGQAAGTGAADAGTRLAATGQVAGDRSNDLGRRLTASDMIRSAESDDAAKRLAASQMLSSIYESGADRQLNATQAAGDTYLANRDQQLQSLSLMPTWQNMNYTDIEKALGAGGARDAMTQRQLDEKVAAFDFGQNAPWNNAQRYLAMTGGGSPGTTTSMTGGGASPLAAILSGLGGMGSMAGMLGWKPFG